MSESVPRPNSLITNTIEAIRKQILGNRFRENLPGEPRLASELGVSRGTLRRALEALENEGLVAPARQGESRKVVANGRSEGAPKERLVAVLISKPVENLPLGTQLAFRDLEERTRQEGIRFVYHISEANRLSQPTRRLNALLAEHEADLWLLHEASRPVAQFFKSIGISAIICGGPGPDVGLPICGFNGSAAVRHAIGVFTRAGHRDIVMATRFPRPIREKLMREEFEKRGMPFDMDRNMPCWENDREKLERLLVERLEDPARSTAWILNGLDALIMIFSTLLTLRLQVPKDVSILSMGSDPMLDCFRPAVGHYSSPHRILATAIAGMIRDELTSPGGKPRHRRLETEYVPGGSVGKVRV